MIFLAFVCRCWVIALINATALYIVGAGASP